MRLSRTSLIVPFFWFGLSVGFPWSILVAQSTDLISGQVVDDSSQSVADVMVVICDSETGLPIDHKNRLIGKENNVENLRATTTDDDGKFSFQDLNQGKFRLLAQSWVDARELPDKPLDKNGRVVRLHGIAPTVELPFHDVERGTLTIHPLGNCTLEINTNPAVGNDSVLLVASRKPLAADPILGFAAWSGDFMKNMIFWNRMMHGKTTVHGLPPGKIFLAAFALDNNPGFGGIEIEIRENEMNQVTIPLIASWSDGVRDPPFRLRPLMKQIESLQGSAVTNLVGEQYPEIISARDNLKEPIMEFWGFWIPYLDHPVQIDKVEVSIKDLIAAERYLNLDRHAKSMEERRKQATLQKMNVDSTITYSEAFEDLFETLHSNYPCFDLKQIDWVTVGQRFRNRVKDVADDGEFGLLCMELVAALQDSHAQLLPGAAKPPKIPLPNWESGFACLEDDRGQAVVYVIHPRSSAATAGLKIGMTIDLINGRETSELIEKTMQLRSKYLGYSSPQYLRYHGFRFFARQFEPGSFTILATDVEGVKHEFTLQAKQSAGYLNRLPVPLEGIPDSSNVSWKILDDDIGYIYVRRIKGPDLITSLDQAVDQLRNAKGLIIDVRGNSGGRFDFNRSHTNFDPNLTNEPLRPRFLKPIAVLTDSRCISAGEGWASWFVANDRARLFGQPTAGASARKTTYTMINGLYHVRYPVKAYKGYLDRPIERIGLTPDVVVRQSAADLAIGRDTVLEAARTYLIEQSKKE